jgi:hypothetical protein
MKAFELIAKGWRPLDVEDVPVLVSPDMTESVAFDPTFRRFPNLGEALHDGMPVSVEEFSRPVTKSAAKP